MHAGLAGDSSSTGGVVEYLGGRWVCGVGQRNDGARRDGGGTGHIGIHSLTPIH